MMKLFFTNKTAYKISPSLFSSLFPKIEWALKEHFAPHTIYEIGLILVSSQKIRSINKKHRGIDMETDVISLNLMPDITDTFNPQRYTLAGEIYISVETAISQTEEHGYPLDRELQILFVHGILHIFGYDHERTKRETQKMHQKEIEILGEQGLIR